MARIGISEFTFGFGYLASAVQAAGPNLVGYPVLPAGNDEARLGWDAELPLVGTSFFFQFKLSRYMSSRTSRFLRWAAPDFQPPFYNAPYYEFELMKDDWNQQHRRLRVWCQEYPDTYYVAPEFRNETIFNQAFLRGSVETVSRHVSVADCFDIDDEAQHWITYQPGQPFVQWSEPQIGAGPVAPLAELLVASRKRWQTLDVSYVYGLVQALEHGRTFGATSESIGRVLEAAEAGHIRDALRLIATPVATELGLTMFVVGTREQL